MWEVASCHLPSHAATSDDQVWLVQINQRVGAYGILVKLVVKIIRF